MNDTTGILYDKKVDTSKEIYKWIIESDILVRVNNFYGVITVVAPNRKTTMAVADGLWESEFSDKFDYHRISDNIIVITANK